MKLAIAGTRDFRLSPEFIRDTLSVFNLRHDVKEVVSGGASGVDWAGEEYSIEYLDKPAKVFAADWTMGVGAGPERNADIADYADALLIIWDGSSPGSASMKTEMLSLKKPIYEILVKAPK